MADRKDGLKRLAEMRRKVDAVDSPQVDAEADADALVVEVVSEPKVARVIAPSSIERYHRVMADVVRLATLYEWESENADASQIANPFPSKRIHLYGSSLAGHTLVEITISFDKNGDMLMRFYSSAQNIDAVGSIGAFNRYLMQVANANAIISQILSVYDQ